jgi:hypothetical protein
VVCGHARQRAGEARSSHPMPSITPETCDDRCESFRSSSLAESTSEADR